MPLCRSSTAADSTIRPDHPWRATLGFVAVALGLSWVPWLTLLGTSGNPFTDPRSMALYIAGGFGPTVAGVIFAYASRGRSGLGRLGRGLTRWRLGRSYLLLLLPLPVIVIGLAAVVTLGEATWEPVGLDHLVLLPTALIAGILLGGLEEIGWRGYLQPRLQDRFSALTVGLVIGLVWALWHAPLFLIESTSQASFSPVWFTIHAVAFSVVLTWVYNSTGGSLLVAVLFHGATNGWYDWTITGLAPDAVASFLGPTGVLLALLATWLVWRDGPADLAPLPRQGWLTQ